MSWIEGYVWSHAIYNNKRYYTVLYNAFFAQCNYTEQSSCVYERINQTTSKVDLCNLKRRKTIFIVVEHVTHISYACIEVPIVLQQRKTTCEVGSVNNHKIEYLDNNTILYSTKKDVSNLNNKIVTSTWRLSPKLHSFVLFYVHFHGRVGFERALFKSVLFRTHVFYEYIGSLIHMCAIT